MKTIKKGSRGEEVILLQRALHLIEDGIFGPLTEEAVLEHQRAYGLEPDGIVGALTWATLNIDEQKSTLKLKSKRSINKLIVHCTATEEGKEYSVAEIRKWHLKRGFSDIGYHFLIGLDGVIHTGRPIDKSGAHTAGYNTHSIGICYVGGLDKNHKAKDTRTPEQKASLLQLLKDLKKIYPKATIHGHYEFANKACPCFKPKEEYKSL
jgi:Putative peptidoglycan-binding domain-containing protein